MKKNNIKIISSVVAIAMMASVLTACSNGDQKDDRTTVPMHTEATATVPDIEEPNQTAATLPTEASESTTVETTTEPTETTAPQPSAPTGEFTLVMYEGTDHEIPLSMGVDWNTMTYQGRYEPMIPFNEFVSNLGWLADGIYTYQDLEESISEDYCERTRGLDNVYILGDTGIEIDFVTADNPTFGNFWYQITDVVIFIPDDDVRGEEYVFHFEKHEIGIGYDTFQQIAGSRDDVTFVTYLFWAISNQPDNIEGILSPFAAYNDGDGNYVLP